jgi:hypothetical protein
VLSYCTLLHSVALCSFFFLKKAFVNNNEYDWQRYLGMHNMRRRFHKKVNR